MPCFAGRIYAIYATKIEKLRARKRNPKKIKNQFGKFRSSTILVPCFAGRAHKRVYNIGVLKSMVLAELWRYSIDKELC